MNNIRNARKIKGWTCEQLGNMIGVQKSAVSKYERDEIQPSKDILLSLAKVLEVTTDYLLGLTNDPIPSHLVVSTPQDTTDITFDDFAFAMQNESGSLTEDEKEMLLSMAKMFNAKRNERDNG